MPERFKRPFLVRSHFDMRREGTYQTGDIVLETGIYRVVHSRHRLSHELIIRKNERFPRCAKCNDAVLFELAHAAPDLYGHLTYRIYELPVIEETDEKSPARSRA